METRHITVYIKTRVFIQCARALLAFSLSRKGYIYRQMGLCMHTHTHMFSRSYRKHTLKLLFGLASRKQVSPLNLAIVMATAKWARGVNEGVSGPSSTKWDCQSFLCWHGQSGGQSEKAKLKGGRGQEIEEEEEEEEREVEARKHLKFDSGEGEEEEEEGRSQLQ